MSGYFMWSGSVKVKLETDAIPDVLYKTEIEVYHKIRNKQINEIISSADNDLSMCCVFG